MKLLLLLALVAGAVAAGWYGYQRLDEERRCGGVGAGAPEYGVALTPAAQQAGRSNVTICR